MIARPGSSESPINLRKAAIFMISIGPKASAQVLKHLSEEEMEKILAEISRIKTFTPEELEGVQSEFQQMVMAQQYIALGGIDYSHEVLKEAVGEAKALEILRRVQSAIQVKGFNVLKNVDTPQLLAFLQKEHPQTIALLLTQLSPQQAASLLTELPPSLQIDVVNRVAKMERVSPETLAAVERVLESHIEFAQGVSALGGIKMAAEILNLVGQRYEKHILNGIARQDPNLAMEIKNLMFTFEDLLMLDDRAIQRVLKETETHDLAMALKACSEELKKKILANMSKRAGEMILEELEYMGPVRLREVEEVQQKIVDVVRRLEEEGEIVVSRRSEEEQLV